MQTLGGSCHDLQALARGQDRGMGGGMGGGMRRTKVRPTDAVGSAPAHVVAPGRTAAMLIDSRPFLGFARCGPT